MKSEEFEDVLLHIETTLDEAISVFRIVLEKAETTYLDRLTLPQWCELTNAIAGATRLLEGTRAYTATSQKQVNIKEVAA